MSSKGHGIETTWGVGEYPLMAERLLPVAAAAVNRADVHARDRVVDVATGTGNAALLAAARGAEAVGVDSERSLLRLAEQRSVDAGLDVRWERGDIAALPVPDGWATVVLSVFGVMYAADHAAAARELARCAAPDARVVLASWAPGSFMPAMGQALSDFLPPPPASSGPPSRWGDPAAVEELLTAAGLKNVECETENLTLSFADANDAADFLVRTAGHVVAERQRLIAEGRWDDLISVTTDLTDSRGRNEHRGLDLDCAYLLVNARAIGER